MNKQIIIGIDAHNIRGNGGSLIHLKELLSHTNPDEQKFDKLIVWVNEETLLKLPKLSFITYIKVKHKGALSSLFWQRYKLKKEAIENKCNILFFPGGIYLGEFKPFVAFSQSMLPFDHKIRRMYWKTSLYPKLIFKEILMKYTFDKADGIVFVSEAMKEQVEKVMKRTFANSTVIHHGVSEIFFNKKERITIDFENDKIKLLTVSSHALHKNLINLVITVGKLKKENYKVELKIVGPYSKYGSIQLLKTVKQIDPHGEFIKIIGDVEYLDLPKYYEEADIFIFPSLCESFGMPLLEGIMSRIKVVCSELPIVNEIGLKNKYIEPLDDKYFPLSMIWFLIEDSICLDSSFCEELKYSFIWSDKCNNTLQYFIKTRNEFCQSQKQLLF